MRNKIFEYNPSTDVMRWRYEDESHDDFGWPNYGRIMKKKKEDFKYYRKYYRLKSYKDSKKGRK